MSSSISELKVRLARETGLSPPVKWFTDRSKAVLLLWIFYVFFLSCVCYAFVCVCLFVPHSIFKSTFNKQTVQNLIRRRSGFSLFAIVPIKRTLGLNGLLHFIAVA